MFLSHIDVSLSLSLPFPLSKINKHELEVRIEGKEEGRKKKEGESVYIK